MIRNVLQCRSSFLPTRTGSLVLFPSFRPATPFLSFPAGRKLLKFRSQSQPRRNSVKELFRRFLIIIATVATIVVITLQNGVHSVLLSHFPRYTRLRRRGFARSHDRTYRIRARDWAVSTPEFNNENRTRSYIYYGPAGYIRQNNVHVIAVCFTCYRNLLFFLANCPLIGSLRCHSHFF